MVGLEQQLLKHLGVQREGAFSSASAWFSGEKRKKKDEQLLTRKGLRVWGCYFLKSYVDRAQTELFKLIN